MLYGIIALTRGALELAVKIKSKIPESIIHTLRKWDFDDGETIDSGIEDYTGKIFKLYEVIVFITASGIAVRSISRHIVSKSVDPGILVIDEKGEYVISLLSGHSGGANLAAENIAAAIGAVPVITTSSDVQGLISVDMLAEELNCKIDSPERAKEITAIIVNRGSVSVKSKYRIKIPEIFSTDNGKADGYIYITGEKVEKEVKPFVQLFPLNIIIGIGCRKNTDDSAVINLIDEKLLETGIDKRCIRSIATVDFKANESGILSAARHFNTELKIFRPDDIRSVESNFESSEFVREKTGIGAVCEPCAYLASNRTGKMILNKNKKNGITIAIWEEEWEKGK